MMVEAKHKAAVPPSGGRPAEALRIEDYALLGDTFTAALVGSNGSIDWLCLPRFDSGACFAALLGGPENGRWLLAPAGQVRAVSRRYRDGTLVLDTEFETDTGAVAVTDFMPLPSTEEEVDVVRIVRGLRGEVPMRLEAVVRFDYGHVVPWLRRRRLRPPGHRRAETRCSSGRPSSCATRTSPPRRSSRCGRARASPSSLRWYKSPPPEPPIQHPEALLECTAAGGATGRASAPTRGPGPRRCSGR